MMEKKEKEKPRQEKVQPTKASSKVAVKERKVNDVIYDFIYHDQIIWDIIDTPEFQRLRKIKKLECLEYVCPSANHSRYEHSVGSAYLAKLFINTLIKNNPQAYQPEERQSAVRTITVAALVYGLGYPPFHHAFQSQIISKDQGKWTLEGASIAIFEKILGYKSELRSKLSKDQIQRIKDLINGNSKQKERPWQFDLINNRSYGIDIDKLEGFRRDAFNIGNRNLYVQNELLINEARIVKNELLINGEQTVKLKLAYPIKYIDKIYDFFDTRYKFYKEYYFNFASMGIQQMICDVLGLIQERFHLQRACSLKNIDEYLSLNDSILSKIKWTQFLEQTIKIEQDPVKKEKLQKQLENSKSANKILQNLSNRNIYKLVKQLMYYIHEEQNMSEDLKSKIEIKKKMLQKDYILKEISLYEDLKGKICFTLSDGFGATLTNPFAKVNFFKINNGKLQLQKDIEKLGKRYKQVPIERSIKFYVKQSDENIFKIGQKMIQEFSHHFNKLCSSQKIEKFIYIYEGKEGKGTTTKGQTLQNITKGKAQSPFKQ